MSKKDITKLLLDWYDANGRKLPWRMRGAHSNPYVVLVSEIMLQQTGVKTVIPYFRRFIEAFPTIESLATAEEDHLMSHWQGLGYYSRARALQETARQIITLERFPDTTEDLLKLKGIGPYTGASIMALAFNKPETVIDGNVIRVICRLYNLSQSVDSIKSLIRQKAEALTDTHRAADYASAIMDFGALVCTPKKPNCIVCPLMGHCLSFKKGTSEKLPVRTKPPKAFKKGRVYLITNAEGGLFIRKRTEKGLLSGLYEFPWTEKDAPLNFEWPDDEVSITGTGLKVSHTFTHFKLELEILTVYSNRVSLKGLFIKQDEFSSYPFSTLMKKVYNAFFSQS